MKRRVSGNSKGIHISRSQIPNNEKWLAHVRERVKRAVLIMKKVWGIGKRIMKDDFSKKMFMFNSLVASGLMYDAEMFGWKEWENLETVQIRH